MKVLIFDCEIVKCIPPERKIFDPRVEYCGGWWDFANMGISVIGTWRNYNTLNPFGKYEAFTTENLDDFAILASKCDRLVGFNSIGFDDKLLWANGLIVESDFDLLREVRIASGQPPDYVKGKTRQGYNLDALAMANLGYGKSGSGELAPKLWQMGHQKRVVKYCLQDVKITKELYFKFIGDGLIDPTDNKTILKYQLST
jgi:hypothetical protein